MAEPNAAAARFHYWCPAVLVMILAAAQRLHGLSDLSLTVDESTVFTFGKSVLEHGYPVIFVGSIEIQLATYELLTYIIGLFIGVFGTSDFAIRLHSVVFATGTAYLVYSAGCKWFNLRTGLLAGLLYATMPWAIFWGQNAFHPQTHQFFAMLTVMQAERILRADAVPPRTYYLAALFFSLGFLSWEGLGFILPVLFVVALIMRWGEWRWLKSRHLWIACAIVIVVIVAQGARRVLLMDNYLMVGSGRSEITGPELAFLQPYFRPYFYADQIFGRYSQFVVAVVFGLGVVFVRHWHFRFLALFVVTAVLVMANLLSFYALHYIYFALPPFVVAVAGATVLFADSLGERFPWPSPRAAGVGGAIVLAALGGLELATAGIHGLKTYAITEAAEAPVPTDYGTRLDMELIDHRGAGAQLIERHAAGDSILRSSPLSVGQYTGKYGDMMLQSWTVQKVIFDPGGERTRYMDITTGHPVLRNKREWQDAMLRSTRIWLVEPGNYYVSAMDSRLYNELYMQTKPIAESYQVKLLLWTR